MNITVRELFTKKAEQYDRIVTNPGIFDGIPTIRGTRLSIEQILGRIYVLGDLESVLAYYPYLDREDVLQAIAFSQDMLAELPFTAFAPSPEARDE